jgi:uncharacterized protein YjbI with pentapeptide repeats
MNLSGDVDLSGATLIRANLIQADLSDAHLYRADLSKADLRKALLYGTNLSAANLDNANFSEANLSEASFRQAFLFRAYLGNAVLCRANFSRANLIEANLSGAHLNEANLDGAYLGNAVLYEADLSNANLDGANLSGAHLGKAVLSGANLQGAILVDTDLTGADLTGCRIFGVSAWRLKLEGAKQENLIITPKDEPNIITADDIEVAQFIYLLLHNEKIRDVIDTLGKKAVLILGRFTANRKAVLDAIREDLRKRDYLPILFDFDKPSSQDLTATVSTLAHLARFIIADITDPSSIPYELATVVPTTPVPVQPILLSGSGEFAMFPDLRRRHHWVLPTHHYDNQTQLIADLGEKVIRPAELKVQDLRGGTGQA